MAIDVTVLRVFTDRDGKFGNPLGVVEANTVDPSDHQRIANQLGYSETIFIDVPEPGVSTAHARIYTPATELPFAGHPAVHCSVTGMRLRSFPSRSRPFQFCWYADTPASSRSLAVAVDVQRAVSMRE